jgi:hypothetical protein
MAYATLQDVVSYLPKWRIAADTQPTSSEVVKYLDRLSARLNGICAGQGYVIPITADGDTDILKSICLAGAGWYVGRTLFPNGGVDAVEDYRKEFEQMLIDLTTGVMTLPDSGSSTTIELETVMTGNATAGSAMVPFFTRAMQF